MSKRTLFIALGGSGGKTLSRLYDMMSAEQRETAKCIYFDTDRKDIDAMTQKGVEAVRISTANSVRQLADNLGADSGVYDWLPNNNSNAGNREFLDSNVDNGAAQMRFKSRLCMARYLKNPNNKLVEVMKSLMIPGIALKEEDLSVVIVSSIAGGTGAGTFIEIALYVRNFMREHTHDSIRIIGILGCPDLYKDANTDEEGNNELRKKKMYANAYAAIRELNAMNLVTSGDSATTNDYGKGISIAIDTASEGKLFDSKDPKFTSSSKAKPFDQIYFVDQSNQEGGILSSVDKYYKLMADIAYTKLYSPLADDLASLESNELDSHSLVPTAIYGGAGYARLIYPYEDLLKYLAQRKTMEEISLSWRFFDDQWKLYSDEKMDRAAAEGETWQPKADERGEEFIKQVDADLDPSANSSKPRFSFLEKMIKVDGKSRVSAYLETISNLTTSVSGMVPMDSTATPEDIMIDGQYSITKNDQVQTVLENLTKQYEIACAYFTRGKEFSDATAAPSHLKSLISQTEAIWPMFSDAISSAITGQAVYLASIMMPTTDAAMENAAKRKDPANIYWGLLHQNNKDIHPLAARYLLYQLQKELRAVAQTAKNTKGGLSSRLAELMGKLSTCLDYTDDDDNFTTTDRLKQLTELLSHSENGGLIGRISRREIRDAEDDLVQYCEKLLESTNEALNVAKQFIQATAYEIVLESLNELVSQYEGFFDNLEQYQIALERSTRGARVAHDRIHDQCIYIGASSYMKDYYYDGENSIKALLESGGAECYAAAGAGLYEALALRTRKAVQDKKIARRMKTSANVVKDTYDDLSSVFDNIINKYTNHLRENCTFLKQDVIEALVKQICVEENLDRRYISTGELRVRFENAMAHKFGDLRAKAKPLIRYNPNNLEKYYVKEEAIEDDGSCAFDVSITYSFVGLSSSVKKRLSNIFPSVSDEDALEYFNKTMGLRTTVVNDIYSDYEIFCFGAVHCLQPTQIYHFNEQGSESYYADYQEIVRGAVQRNNLSASPHLDKRWHLKGCMPYISKTLEQRWRREMMKAFLSEILRRKIVFTKDGSGVECFISRRNGINFIQWPEGSPILLRNVSRLLEFLAEDETKIEEYAKDLDLLIAQEKRKLAGYCNTPADYKRGMTNNKMLSRMRHNALSYSGIGDAGSGKNTKKADVVTDEEKARVIALRMGMNTSLSAQEASEEEIVDIKKTMGGILQLAYLIHTSEEVLGEDRDYGEALLDAAAYVVDELAKGLYGEYHVTANSQQHREYIDIYNHAMDKVMDAYVEAKCRQKKWDSSIVTMTQDDDDLLEQNVAAKAIGIPAELQNTDEYIWITNHWKHKTY